MTNKQLRQKIILALAAISIATAGQAWADAPPVFQLDQVTVTADRLPRKVNATPGSVTVITGEQLRLKGARTLTDALHGVPGVHVQCYGGAGQKAIPFILGTDRVVVLQDGRRLNLPQGIGTGAGGIDLNTVLLGDNVEKIEIVRGGASALYGADAVGGVINVITKKGAPSPAALTLAAGNYGGRHYDFTAADRDGKTSWRLQAAKDLGDGQRPNSAWDSRALSFRLDYDCAPAAAITFTYDYFGNHSGIPGSLKYPSLTDYQDTVRNNWSLGYQAGDRLLRYYANNNRYSGDSSGTFDHRNTVRVLEYQDSSRLDAANLLTWGGEWRRDKVESTAEGNTPHTGITRALYLQNRWTLNRRAELTLGLRRDASSIYGVHLLPKAAFWYQATPATGYYANWGKIFKAPKFDDLYGDDGWGNTGNPDLKPETGWTAEVGVKSRLSPAAEATVAVFRRDLSDAIKWQMDPDFTFHPRNLDRYRADGLNAAVTLALSPATTGDIGYTWLKSRDHKGEPAGDPRHSFQAGISITDGRWTQKITGVYQGESGLKAARVSPRFVVNTHSAFQLDKKTSLFLTVNNLFNRQYQGVRNYPAQERTFLLGVRQEF